MLAVCCNVFSLRAEEIVGEEVVPSEAVEADAAVEAEAAAPASDVVAIKGSACEKFVDGQLKSTTRVKVTDKACYNGVSQLQSLAEIKNKIPDYDYNVLVYDLVDNYVQDLTVRTVSQNKSELCVEVQGNIPSSDIVNLIANQVAAVHGNTEYDFAAENGIGEEKIDVAAAVKEEQSQQTPESEVLYEGEAKPSDAELDAQAVADEKALVYVAPTWFFDGTQSTKLSEAVRELFADAELYRLTEDENAADYTLYPNVNKAKIDSINAQTKRMQMVVSVELKSKKADVSATEHQNRFVLYENGEDEQTVAQTLLKKLFKKAGKKLFERVDKIERKRQSNKTLPPIITPAVVQPL